ncbi:MAG: PilZ domain-containing protein [Phycisphaerae bacterium]
MQPDQERRHFSRVKYDVDATLEFQQELFESDLIDLSLRGALVSTGASPRKGQEVALRFSLAQSGVPVSVRCQGTVVRNDQRGVGIRFDQMDVDSFNELKAILSNNLGDADRVEHEFQTWLAGQAKTSEA